MSELNFGPETGLFDIAGPLVWILSADLQLRQVEGASGKRGQAILELEYWSGATHELLQIIGNDGGRIEGKNAFRPNANAVLVEDTIAATEHNSVPRVIAET